MIRKFTDSVHGPE